MVGVVKTSIRNDLIQQTGCLFSQLIIALFVDKLRNRRMPNGSVREQ